MNTNAVFDLLEGKPINERALTHEQRNLLSTCRNLLWQNILFALIIGKSEKDLVTISSNPKPEVDWLARNNHDTILNALLDRPEDMLSIHESSRMRVSFLEVLYVYNRVGFFQELLKASLDETPEKEDEISSKDLVVSTGLGELIVLARFQNKVFPWPSKPPDGKEPRQNISSAVCLLQASGRNSAT